MIGTDAPCESVIACCVTRTVAVPGAMSLRYVLHAPRERPTHLCLTCGALNGRSNVAAFDEHTIAKVRLQHLVAITSNGSAEVLGLPTLAAIASRMPAALAIPTTLDKRIEDDFDAVRKTPQLRIELRNRLIARLAVRDLRPRAISTPYLGHPIILHAGLAVKFTRDEDLDSGHIRFAGYIPTVLRNPLEAWLDVDGTPQRKVFRVVGALRVGASTYFMHVLVEADSHIITTAYVVDRSRHM
jgi:hypothetical protein